MGVIEIMLDPQFLSSYHNGSTLHDSFKGEVKVHTLNDYLRAKTLNANSVENCYRIVFGAPASGGGGGGEGLPGRPTGGVFPGDTPPPGGGTTGGGGGSSGCYEIVLVCGCDPHHVGGSGGNPICRCGKADVYILRPCNQQLRGVSFDNHSPIRAPRQKSNYWDCVDLLGEMGLLTDSDLFLHRLIQCEHYQQPYDVGDSPSTVHPDYSFCDTWITYRDRCIASPSTNMDEVNVRWAALMWRNRAAFDQLLQSDNDCTGDARIRLVYEELMPEIGLSGDEANWLFDHPAVATEINLFLQNHTLEHESAAREASAIYLRLLKEDTEFAELSTAFGGIPPFVWPFIRQVAVEMAIELIKRNVPGISDYNNVIDAINNLQQGDVLGFFGEVLDIVKKKFPVLAAVNLALDGYELGSAASKAWKAYSKMAQFGNDIVGKFTEVLVNRAGGILGKFKWKNNSVGAELFDVDDPQRFVDEFMALFPNVQGPLFLNQLHPLEQTYEIGSLIIRFYPVSNTTGGPTLSFVGSPNFKIRFQ